MSAPAAARRAPARRPATKRKKHRCPRKWAWFLSGAATPLYIEHHELVNTVLTTLWTTVHGMHH